jgi:hypothetical protein
MEIGLFFYAQISGIANYEIGGGSCAHEDNTGMHRVQAPELQSYQRETSSSGKNGIEEVLPELQKAHFT